MLLVILSIVISLLVWLWLKWTRVKCFWKERGVPFSPPHPLLGSLTFLHSENTVHTRYGICRKPIPGFLQNALLQCDSEAHWLRRYYDSKVPYFGMWLFWKPCLVINSPDLARKILVKDFDNFRNRHLHSGKTDPLGHFNLFVVKDPLWTDLRKRLTPVFTAAKLRTLQNLMREKARDLLERIDGEMAKNREVKDLRTTCTDFTTDVIGESAFGIKSDATRTGDSVIRMVTNDMLHFTISRSLSWTSIFFWPALVDVFRFKFFPMGSMKRLKGLFRAIIDQRGGFDKEVTENRDLLDALLKLRQDAAADKEYMSEDFLLAQAAVFLQAGFDTSGTTLTWALYELAHQPLLQEKLYQELVEAKEKYGTENFDSTQLAEFPYLNAVLKETLRKNAPMGWIDRIAAHDYKVDEHLTIPAGTVVYINAYGMMTDPEYYPEPDTFNPDRFLPENEQDVKPYTYMPFGEGPRNCIGKRYAYQTLRVALSKICLKYTMRPDAKGPSPSNVLIDKKGIFFNPGEDLTVKFTKRN